MVDLAKPNVPQMERNYMNTSSCQENRRNQFPAAEEMCVYENITPNPDRNVSEKQDKHHSNRIFHYKFYMLAVIALCLGVTALTVSLIKQTQRFKLEKLPSSCLEIKALGIKDSGIYTIKPSLLSSSIEVYCDMTSSGGGWTLVASAYKSSIQERCEYRRTIEIFDYNYIGSLDQTYKFSDLKNWENSVTFGNIEAATYKDYKSSAYFHVQASNVMIWHVPQGVEISRWSDEAYLKYFTDTGFLSEYDGTLQSMFAEYFQKAVTLTNRVLPIIEALNASASMIRGAVPDFYSYTYDYIGIQNYIEDGGNNMFDGGNKVFYQIGDNDFQQIVYGETYRDKANRIEVSSTTEHPFTMLMWVGNHQQNTESFAIKVVSVAGGNVAGSLSTRMYNFKLGTYRVTYKSYNVYNTSNPSISEVLFIICNEQEPCYFSPFSSEKWILSHGGMENTMTVSGSLNSILMGYTLLSKSTGEIVEDNEIRSALEAIVQAINSSNPFDDCNGKADKVVVPVSYIQGSNQTVMSSLPPKIRSYTTPGFIQFRSVSFNGFNVAICPGVSLSTNICSSVGACFGGIKTKVMEDPKYCYDSTAGTGFPPYQDRSEMILIFTREV